MPEGPSIVIARDQIKPLVGETVKAAAGRAKLPYKELRGSKLRDVLSWGKHLILKFDDLSIRTHFLMFGSYGLDEKRAKRKPMLALNLVKGREKHVLRFYSAAIRKLDDAPENIYDWSVDIMSEEWDPKLARRHVLEHRDSMVCDVLMDQTIFSGLGNIIKNEVLFRLLLHPEERVRALSPREVTALVREAHKYGHEFLAWKKEGVLKRNWKIMRKRTCPRCGGAVTKRETGVLKRLSHYCPRCQARKP